MLVCYLFVSYIPLNILRNWEQGYGLSEHFFWQLFLFIVKFLHVQRLLQKVPAEQKCNNFSLIQNLMIPNYIIGKDSVVHHHKINDS